MSQPLRRALATLPQPAPPPELAKHVRARIARLEPRQIPARAERPAWTSAAATVAGVVLAVIGVRVGDDVRQPATQVLVFTVGLSAGLTVYLAGLFAAVRRRKS